MPALTLPRFVAVNDNHRGSRPSKTIGYCLAWDGSKGVVGMVQDDGGVRVDYHGPLEELSFWKVEWKDPDNPWIGIRRSISEWPTKLVPRYS